MTAGKWSTELNADDVEGMSIELNPDNGRRMAYRATVSPDDGWRWVYREEF